MEYIIRLYRHITTLYVKQQNHIKYFFLSLFVTIIDFAILFILFNRLNVNLTVSNTISVVSGFLIHYLIGSKTVFKTPYGITGFVVYISTFLLGIYLANMIINFVVARYTAAVGKEAAVVLGKGFSIAIPYFIMYYIRKSAFFILNKYKNK